MFALGYAFCLKVGEAICPQKVLKIFVWRWVVCSMTLYQMFNANS